MEKAPTTRKRVNELFYAINLVGKVASSLTGDNELLPEIFHFIEDDDFLFSAGSSECGHHPGRPTANNYYRIFRDTINPPLLHFMCSSPEQEREPVKQNDRTIS